MATRSREIALLGGLLSFLVPGMGQFIQQRRRAAGFFFLSALLIYLAVFLASMLIFESVVPVWVQAIGIGWHGVAGVEGLSYVLRVQRDA